MALPRIRGTQVGLRDPALVDQLKVDMIAGTYAFEEDRGRIGGVIDSHGTHHVVDGHHRMAAALEILQETGDEKAVQTLIDFGRWTQLENPARDSRPFPHRTFWGTFRNWLGY